MTNDHPRDDTRARLSAGVDKALGVRMIIPEGWGYPLLGVLTVAVVIGLLVWAYDYSFASDDPPGALGGLAAAIVAAAALFWFVIATFVQASVDRTQRRWIKEQRDRLVSISKLEILDRINTIIESFEYDDNTGDAVIGFIKHVNNNVIDENDHEIIWNYEKPLEFIVGFENNEELLNKAVCIFVSRARLINGLKKVESELSVSGVVDAAIQSSRKLEYAHLLLLASDNEIVDKWTAFISPDSIK